MHNNQKKGFGSLAVMAVLTVGLIFGSEGAYSALRPYTPQVPAEVALVQQELNAAYDAETSATDAETSATIQELPQREAAVVTGDGMFNPGTYSCTAQGFGGPVEVTITVDDNAITDVKIVGDGETPALGGVAVKELAESILARQTPNVDAVSGATVTSKAIIAAATDSLLQAGGDIAALDSASAQSAGSQVRQAETKDVDIAIIGAGGAGMTAAIKATEAGKKVVILEKMSYGGGNTTKATGGMNAAETHYQAEQNIEDSVEQFVADTMKAGHEINNKDLVTIMAEKSAAAIEWLDSIGAPLPKVSFSGGATNARIHAPEDGSGVGEYLVEAFQKQLEEKGIEVLYKTEATELMEEGGKIVGVKASSDKVDYTINAKAVIMATGGFGASEEMILKYRPDLLGTVTTNAPGATGDGIIMAEAVGADLVDIDEIQLHPTVEQTTSILITEGVRGDGAILVNQSGERFTDELQPRDVVSAAELAQEGHYAYIIFDQKLRDGLKAIEKYVNNGITVQSDTIEGLAGEIGVDPATLEKTLKDWNAAVASKNDAAFGRTTGMEHDLSTAPYYAIKIAPGIHHTMGGLKIDTEARVLDKSGKPIEGLFAAGEVTGGVHGGNRVGGNAVADIVIFGNIAAQSAMDYIK